MITMSVVMFIFEEFTAFTDYTQDWIEFNFFISYWDKLTISRVYLWFIFIYGGVILTSKYSGVLSFLLLLLLFSNWLISFTHCFCSKFHANTCLQEEKHQSPTFYAILAYNCCSYHITGLDLLADCDCCEFQWGLFSHGWLYFRTYEIQGKRMERSKISRTSMETCSCKTSARKITIFVHLGTPVSFCLMTYLSLLFLELLQLDLFFKDEVEILNVAAGIRTKTTYMEVGLNYPSLVAKE